MKIKLPKKFFLALLVLGLFNILSCKKDIYRTANLPANHWAKDHYDNVLINRAEVLVDYKKFNKLRPEMLAQLAKTPNKRTPIWDSVVVGNTGIYDFVELPLAYDRKKVSSVRRQSKFLKDNESIFSFDRLVIYKDKKGKVNERW